MKEKSKILKLVLGAIILILGGVLLFFIARKFLATAGTLSQVKNEVKVRYDRIGDLKELQAQYEKIEDQIKEVSSLLPDESNFVRLVEYWERIADSFNLALKIQFPKEGTAPAPASPKTAPTPGSEEAAKSSTSESKPTSGTASSQGKITAVLDATGGVENLLKFWQAIEEGRYFIKVLQATIDAPAGRGGDGRLILKIEVSTDESFPPN